MHFTLHTISYQHVGIFYFDNYEWRIIFLYFAPDNSHRFHTRDHQNENRFAEGASKIDCVG